MAPSASGAFLLSALLLGSASGCASTPTQPPGAPPTPKSVTLDEPGGDAFDPHAAALQRQLDARWRSRRDKDNQIRIPLTDKRNWKRVRFVLVDHFTGFRYGEDLHSLNIVLVQDIDRDDEDRERLVDARACLTRAEEWAKPQLDAFGVDVSNVSTTYVTWKEKRIPVRVADAHFDHMFESHDVSAAWASYPAYPDACLIFGFVVHWDGHPELAKRVRERWIKEGVRKLRTLTDTRPFRKED